MIVRRACLTLAFLAFLPAFAPGQDLAGPAPRWRKESDRRNALAKGLTWFNWEGLTFLVRRNNNYVAGELSKDYAQTYNRQTDPDNLAKLAAAGVKNPGNLHFYKGFGIEAERADREKAIAGAKLAHHYGMEVSVYIGGTMEVETFYHETPAARDWEQKDAFGRPIPYTPTQTFRHYASQHEPAYRDYLKRVLKMAVEEAHADEIYFDNTWLNSEPYSDHGPQAVQAFRTFLTRRYPTPEAALARFGISDAGLIQAPEWDEVTAPRRLTDITDPALQEWTRFRCESNADYYRDFYAYIKKLNPRVAVGVNIKGIYPRNLAWENGVYHPLFAGCCDFVSFDSGGYDARIDRASGALVAQFRAYLWGRRLGISFIDDKMSTYENPVSGIPTTHPVASEYKPEAECDLGVATYMAFGFQKPNPGGFATGSPDQCWVSNIITPTMEFFRHYNERYYTRTELVTDVGVLRTWPSQAYTISPETNYVPLTLTEQVLIQHKVPFEIFSDEGPDRFDRYRAIVLAGQDSISDATIDRLLAYVRGGGCVVAAPDSGAFDENRRRRDPLPFEIARTEGRGRILTLPTPVIERHPRRRNLSQRNETAGDFGKGESAAVDAPEPSLFLLLQILPENHEAIAQTVLDALGSSPAVATGAPLTTVLTLVHRPETKETILHLVNFENRSDGKSFPVTVQPGSAAPVKSVKLFSPDHDDPIDLSFREDHGRVSFDVPEPRVYAMIVIAQD